VQSVVLHFNEDNYTYQGVLHWTPSIYRRANRSCKKLSRTEYQNDYEQYTKKVCSNETHSGTALGEEAEGCWGRHTHRRISIELARLLLEPWNHRTFIVFIQLQPTTALQLSFEGDASTCCIADGPAAPSVWSTARPGHPHIKQQYCRVGFILTTITSWSKQWVNIMFQDP
jgi:hypothetical protein